LRAACGRTPLPDLVNVGMTMGSPDHRHSPPFVSVAARRSRTSRR
jgi:hypothetical protein